MRGWTIQFDMVAVDAQRGMVFLFSSGKAYDSAPGKELLTRLLLALSGKPSW
jgi:hypothetical protein